MLFQNLFEDPAANHFLDIYQSIIIYKTYKHARIKRDLAKEIKRKIESFFELYKSGKELSLLDKMIDIFYRN